MSRTYRRKGNTPHWVKYSGEYICCIWVRVPITGKELEQKINDYHADRDYWCNTPDKKFRRLYGHKYDRQDTRRNIHKEIKSIERGDVVFNKTRNIDWIWD